MQSEMYKKIVIATDGSENAKKAASSAIEMAKMTGAKLFALNVLPYIPHFSYFGVPMDPPKAVSLEEKEFQERLEEDGQRNLDVVKDMAEKAGVEVETVMVKGHPGSEIISFSEKNDIDLIVMGTLGRSGIDRIIMGSVAVDVVRHAKTRVMIVK
ncbi:universal stress protein [uncultured Methanomethylovorans sp.]|uniref:universal stress protein n=1 Tax=uncultured Methanomethylovorans sp. TaxID=183759 RepID=UPI00261D0321|nr:universal stress protein [uncultured Methanomethylovorans sp.]